LEAWTGIAPTFQTARTSANNRTLINLKQLFNNIKAKKLYLSHTFKQTTFCFLKQSILSLQNIILAIYYARKQADSE
jgi:hypothetical protein